MFKLLAFLIVILVTISYPQLLEVYETVLVNLAIFIAALISVYSVCYVCLDFVRFISDKIKGL